MPAETMGTVAENTVGVTDPDTVALIILGIDVNYDGTVTQTEFTDFLNCIDSSYTPSS